MFPFLNPVSVSSINWGWLRRRDEMYRGDSYVWFPGLWSCLFPSSPVIITEFMSAGPACVISLVAFQGICSACVDKGRQTRSMCRTVWEAGKIDFSTTSFCSFYISAVRSWNMYFDMSNLGSSDLWENLFMAMNLICFSWLSSPRSAFSPLAVLHTSVSCPWFIPLWSNHPTLVPYSSLSHRECRGSFLIW